MTASSERFVPSGNFFISKGNGQLTASNHILKWLLRYDASGLNPMKKTNALRGRMRTLAVVHAKVRNLVTADRPFRKLMQSALYWSLQHRRWKYVLQLSNKDKFSAVYAHNLWNNEESRSGGGSTVARTKPIRNALPDLFNRYDIKTVCDAGCGDFNWMQHVDLRRVNYLGTDIVPAIVATMILLFVQRFHRNLRRN